MSDLWGIYPSAIKVAIFLLAAAVLAIVALVSWPRFADKPLARFWLIGAGLSLLPIATSGPMDCNLVFLGFGVAPALAMVFVNALDNPPSLRWQRLIVATLVVCNLAVAPLLLPAKCLTMLGMGFGLPLTDASIPRDAAVASKTLVALWVISEAGFRILPSLFLERKVSALALALQTKPSTNTRQTKRQRCTRQGEDYADRRCN